MAAPSHLAGLLDRAEHVFSLAFDLGREIQVERESLRRNHQVDPHGWARHQSAFKALSDALAAMREEIERPSQGFAPVASVLSQLASVLKSTRDIMLTKDGRDFAQYLDEFFGLSALAVEGQEAIAKAANNSRRRDDPLAFADQLERKSTFPLPHVGERTLRRPADPILARDKNRERQSRYCQGFDPDWWLPALECAEWRTPWYPLRRTGESVRGWIETVQQMRVEYLGPLDDPDQAAKLQADLEHDIAIVIRHAPELLKHTRSRKNPDGIDTTPDYPSPGPEMIESATDALRKEFRNLQNDKFPGAMESEHGERIARADRLVELVAKTGHERAAAAWAIHRCVQRGLLLAEIRQEEVEVGGYEEIDPDCVTMRYQRLLGQTSVPPGTRWVEGRRELKPTFSGKGPVPFQSLLIRSTKEFWAQKSESDMALLDTHLRQPVSFDTIQQEKNATGDSPTEAARNKLKLIRDFNRGLQGRGDADEAKKTSDPAPAIAPDPTPKRSTERGEGRAKLISALTEHHQYADGGCLNLEPIGNNKLAKAAGVSPSTASAFFNDKFQGHTKYKALCVDPCKLAAALRLLNDEFAPYHLLGAASSDLAAPEQDDADSE